MKVEPTGRFAPFEVRLSDRASVGELAELWLASAVCVTFLGRDTSSVMTER